MNLKRLIFGKPNTLAKSTPVYTSIENTKDYKNIIIDKMNTLLKPIGYKRKGNVYTHSINDVTHYISLQSSQTSTSKLLKITVNIEISSLKLAAFRDERMPLNAYRNYHKRIGMFSKEKKDKWWQITNMQEANVTSEEIGDLILFQVIPELELFKSTDDFITSWKQGKCEGITEAQRKYYLQVLNVQ